MHLDRQRPLAKLKQKVGLVAASNSVIYVRGLTVDGDRSTALVDGKPVGLTNTEFCLLLFLARHAGQTFTRREIIDTLKGEDYPATDRTVDVQVTGLRKKLGEYGNLIRAVRGEGYTFVPAETNTNTPGISRHEKDPYCRSTKPRQNDVDR